MPTAISTLITYRPIFRPVVASCHFNTFYLSSGFSSGHLLAVNSTFSSYRPVFRPVSKMYFSLTSVLHIFSKKDKLLDIFVTHFLFYLRSIVVMLTIYSFNYFIYIFYDDFSALFFIFRYLSTLNFLLKFMICFSYFNYSSNPSFMIRSPRIDTKGTIDLFDEDQTHQLVWISHFAKGDLGVASFHDCLA